MAFKKFSRLDRVKGVDVSYIAIWDGKISFGSKFCKEAGLGIDYIRVTIYVDELEYRLGFQFHNNEKDLDSHKLSHSRVNGENARGNISLCSAALQKKYNWISNLIQYPMHERRFTPRKDGNLWVIDIYPSLENSVDSVDSIPTNITGIYQYLDVDGNVIYIGRGNIYDRAQVPVRKSWGINKIQYSIIPDEEQQAFWEAFWLEKHKKYNENNLPKYNRVSGRSFS